MKGRLLSPFMLGFVFSRCKRRTKNDHTIVSVNNTYILAYVFVSRVIRCELNWPLATSTYPLTQLKPPF